MPVVSNVAVIVAGSRPLDGVSFTQLGAVALKVAGWLAETVKVTGAGAEPPAVALTEIAAVLSDRTGGAGGLTARRRTVADDETTRSS